ncbi:ribonuclease E/G [Candidatus Omnitrophota bacterium]
MQEILINIEAGERRVAILRSKKLEWYFVERMSGRSIVGNIYKGKVSSVLDGMGASFIDCGLEKNGFLYVSDITATAVDDDDVGFFYPKNSGKRDDSNQKISDILKKDQEILVQVTKSEIGTKGARLNTNISLPGRYLVLMPMSKRVGVSRRIKDDEERRRIKAIIREMKLPENMGLVARTAAEGCTKRDLVKDLSYLKDTYSKINKLAKKSGPPYLVFEELDMASKVIRDFLGDENSKVIVDDKQEFKRLRHFISRIDGKLKKNLFFHKEDIPLFEKFNIEKEIDKLFERKIYLKCGGYITIEQTEGMIAIDVNSGKFTGKKNLEDTVFKVNLEAAEEVARQLRLRDIGGIVIIDFIDMEIQPHRKQLFSLLQESLKKDRAKTQIISLSELDIVEMTRQRVRRSLESASYRNCPYCDGKGLVKSADTMAIVALRKLKTFLKSSRAKKVAVELLVHPYVAQRLVNEDAPALNFLRRAFNRRITVVSDDKLHVEDINIKP